ncbi:MAG: methyltransferase domain-containing protein, partial [Gammaproteobacteria bacterium]|nr:methyltransferase domain-containing protein [Gammaproteobacteria bacterium]
MSITKAHNLICPIDGVRLEQKDKQMVCDNGHSFDIARQGYINLLPVQHKRSKQPGDSKAMVLARTQFLDTGSYEPIARRLTDTVIEQVGTEGDICILDAGCGEGYYLDAVFNAVSDKAITDSVLDGDRDNNAISFIGIDISKDAVIQSSKRNKQISWIVATNRKPPVADESVDIILCLFGFLSLEAFHKILKPGGKIILVDPGSEHLKELREIIYPDVKKPEEGEGQ